MVFKYSRQLYTKVALLKSAYKFTEYCYIHLDMNEDYYIVSIETKDDNKLVDFEQQFKNEMIEQMNREIVFEQTGRLREVLMARALSTSLIFQPSEDNDSSLEEIDNEQKDEMMKDWFEVYGK